MSQLPKGLSYVDGRLHFSGKAIFEIVENYGTPAYVYSEQILDECLAQFPLNRPGVTVCFAVKANNNLSILERLSKSGAYFDVASSEELRRVAAIAKPQVLKKCVATGPAKSVSFLKDCLWNNVFSIHAECEQELQRIEVLRQKCPESTTKVALRVNLDIVGDAGHAHLATGASKLKFGIPPAEAIRLAERFRVDGLQYHIGSCVLNKEVLYKARDFALDLIEQFELKRLPISYVDVGGSFGIPYEETRKPLNIPEVIDELISPFLNKDIRVFIEPGRSVVAQSGVLVTRVEYIKNTAEANFAFVDAAMNDFIGPALHNSYHRILTEFEPPAYPEKSGLSESTTSPSSEKVLRAVVLRAEKVLRAAESSESLRSPETSKPMPSPRRIDAIPRELTGSKESFDDLLNELQDVGAYGYSMSSNYNSRNKPPQVMILSSGEVKLISRRELLEDQLMLERNIESFIVKRD